MLHAPLPRNQFRDRDERSVDGRDPDAMRPVAHWADHAFPPGYNAATRGVIRDASLAPFRRALAHRVAHLRAVIPNIPAPDHLRASRLAKVNQIEQEGRSANAHGLERLCRRLDDLRNRLQA